MSSRFGYSVCRGGKGGVGAERQSESETNIREIASAAARSVNRALNVVRLVDESFSMLPEIESETSVATARGRRSILQADAWLLRYF